MSGMRWEIEREFHHILQFKFLFGTLKFELEK
jgi:hypothetical protein